MGDEKRVKRQKGGKFAAGSPSPNPGGRPKSNAEIRELARDKAGEAIKVLGEILDGKHGASARERVAAAGQILLFAGGRPPSSAEIDAAERASNPQTVQSWEDLVAAAKMQPATPAGLAALSPEELSQLEALQAKVEGRQQDVRLAAILSGLEAVGCGALESAVGEEMAAKLREGMAREGELQPARVGAEVLIPEVLEPEPARLIPETNPARLLPPAEPKFRVPEPEYRYRPRRTPGKWDP